MALATFSAVHAHLAATHGELAIGTFSVCHAQLAATHFRTTPLLLALITLLQGRRESAGDILLLRRVSTEGEERFHDKPARHLLDEWQYRLLR